MCFLCQRFIDDMISSDFTRLETYPLGKRWSCTALSGRPSPWGYGFRHYVDWAGLWTSAGPCDLCGMIVEGFFKDQEPRVRHIGLFPRRRSRDSQVPRREILVASFDDRRRHVDTIPKHVFRIDQIRPYYAPVLEDMSSGGCFERTIPPSAASEDALETARHWFRVCEEEHPKCKTRSTALPTRVIDVRAGGAPETAALYATCGEKGLYAALTHCWGGKVPCKTTSATLDKYSETLPMDLLPENFLDAIHVTRKLGLRYLWIDALCIVQDSQVDWVAEAARMSSVYSNAVVTISSLSSNGSTEGFLRWRDQPRVVLSDRFAAHRTLPGFEEAMSQSILSSRGWCLQERLLAPALLHFGSDQMYWECRTATWQEDGLPFEPPRRSFEYSFTDTRRGFGLTGPRSTRDWYVFVEDFSNRALTYESDRLPAMAGIASRFRAAGIGGRYLAGHWVEGFKESLFWISYYADRPQVLRLGAEDPRLPTWSWASVGTKVSFKSEEDAGDSLLQILGIDAGGEPEDLAATALKAMVTIRGRVASMEVTTHVRKNGSDIAMPQGDKRGLQFHDDIAARAVLHDFPGKTYWRFESHFAVLVDSRRKTRMLLMQKVRSVPGKGGKGEIPVFRRVGSAEYLSEYLEDNVLARFRKQVFILE